jgi:protein gp37
MAASPQHVFQVLTKRPERMPQWFEWLDARIRRYRTIGERDDLEVRVCLSQADQIRVPRGNIHYPAWPLPNVHLGVSVEDRKYGLPRVDELRKVPAAVRWLSIEPLLEDLGEIDLTGIHWVVVGGESGTRARPFQIEWARSILRQCREQGVPAFMKQVGARPFEAGADGLVPLKLGDRKGKTPEDWPEDLRVRQWPAVKAEVRDAA